MHRLVKYPHYYPLPAYERFSMKQAIKTASAPNIRTPAQVFDIKMKQLRYWHWNQRSNSFPLALFIWLLMCLTWSTHPQVEKVPLFLRSHIITITKPKTKQ